MQEEPHQRDGRLLLLPADLAQDVGRRCGDRLGQGAGSEPLPAGCSRSHAHHSQAAQAAVQRARPRPRGRSQRNRKSRAYWVPVALVWRVGFPWLPCGGVWFLCGVWGLWLPCGGVGFLWLLCGGVGFPWLSCGLWGPHPQ